MLGGAETVPEALPGNGTSVRHCCCQGRTFFHSSGPRFLGRSVCLPSATTLSKIEFSHEEPGPRRSLAPTHSRLLPRLSRRTTGALAGTTPRPVPHPHSVRHLGSPVLFAPLPPSPGVETVLT